MANASSGDTLHDQFYYCHSCKESISPRYSDAIQNIKCPNCNGDFVEILARVPSEFCLCDEPDDWCACGNSSDSSDGSLYNEFFNVASPWSEMQPQASPIDVIDLVSESDEDSIDDELGSNNRATDEHENEESNSPPTLMEQFPSLDRDDQNFISSLRLDSRSSLTNELANIRRDMRLAIQRLHGSLERINSDLSSPSFSDFGGLHGSAEDYAWGPNGIDDVVTELLGQLESSGPPPASKTTIDALPTLLIIKSQIDKGLECSVCMDLFQLNDSAKQLPCEHFFHISCIDPWLVLHNTCPVCRKVVEKETPSCSQPSTSTNTEVSSQSNELSI